MSDSDDDLLPNNVFAFQGDVTTISARGPNINASNLTGLSFRNNVMTSTMNMPRNFERQKYLDQCSYPRHPSAGVNSPPLSLRSESSLRPRNYQHNMYCGRGMSSQRSMMNGRSGSPISMRSMDSNASIVTAADIAMTFKNINFNKNDLRVIKDAYNRYMKKRIRSKIEKRRKIRLLLKGRRRKSGYDSGELGSDSSISSDDCSSMRTSVYKDNMSSCRSTKTNDSDVRRIMEGDNLYKDSTENFRQNTFKNMLGVVPRNATIHMQNKVQNEPPVTQKDRFKSGFLLPSQRFNPSVSSVTIPEKQRVQIFPPNQRKFVSHNATSDDTEIESEQEEIFTEITIREKNDNNTGTQNRDTRKRSIEFDADMSQNKRRKLSSQPKNISSVRHETENIFKDKNYNDFEFLKPQFPVRKSRNKETLLAQSTTPLLDEEICSENVLQPQASQLHCDQNDVNKQIEIDEQPDLTLQSNKDLSMRPSFTKRKLYSQKFELLESKNLSSENLGANSPQNNVYSSIQKEKNKARKLVTNQSCLSRDVREDSNLMDLIHKIVPPDRINVTNLTNRSEVNNPANKNKSEDNKWDVTSVINTCNNDNVSDTYTDEEIFDHANTHKQLSSNKTNLTEVILHNENEKKQATEKISAIEFTQTNEKKQATKKVAAITKMQTNDQKQATKKISANEKKNETENISANGKKENQKTSECKVLIYKLPETKIVKKNFATEKANLVEKAQDSNKENIHNRFWDTDFESDIEGGPANNIVKVKENLNQGNNLNQKTLVNPVNKTLDTSQYKFVWNNQSKPAVALISHSFSNHVKAVNVTKSFTKRTKDNTKTTKNEVSQSEEKQVKISGKDQPKKAVSKKIVLKTHNSTLSDKTQNETIINNNNETREPRAKRNVNTGVDKNDKSTPTTVNSLNDDVQAVHVRNKIATRKSPLSPKEFSCCKEPVHVNKTKKKETELKAKSNVPDSYNSTLSDNTLDEIIKKGYKTRALRATTIKKIEKSIIDDLKSDDSQIMNMTLRPRRRNDRQMLNMTLRPRRQETSLTKCIQEKINEPKKARNCSNQK